MSHQAETPFESIEGALEYVSYLLEATQEAQDHIGTEIVRAAEPQLARRKQALQIVNYKLVKLHSHVAASRRILNDLRTLRRLLLEERESSSLPSKSRRSDRTSRGQRPDSKFQVVAAGAEIEEDGLGKAFS